MSKQKKQKPKRSPLSQKNCLLVTSLTIEECLSRIEAIQNSELEASIQQAESDFAEVRFMERHKNDLAIYGIVRLISIDANQTRVTFERILKRHGQTPGQADIAAVHLLEILDKWSIGFALIFGLIIFLTMPQEAPLLFIVLFIGLGIRSLRRTPDLPSSRELSTERESHLKEQRREEELRADLYHVLWVDDDKTKVDERGDAYYVESPKSKAGYGA